MSGVSCPIFGSSTFQNIRLPHLKYQQSMMNIEKTGGKTVDAIFRDRVIVKGLQSQVNNRTLLAYERYYLVCKMLHHKFTACVFKFSSLH